MMHTLAGILANKRNPVLRAEFRYQRFVIQRSRAGFLPILLAALMIVPALLISIGYSIALLLNLIPPLTIFDLIVFPHEISGVLLIVVNISMYLVVNGVTFGLSSSSVGREKSNGTWHLLRMTAVENHQIVFGKWWASLRALNGDHLMVMVLRIGLLAYCCGVILPIWLSLDGLTAPVHVYFAALLPFVAIQCLLDGALTAAAGVAASMPDAAAGIASGSGATAGRIMLAVGVGIWFVAMIAALRDGLSGALLLAGGGVLVTLALLLAALYAAYVLIEKSE